MRNLTDFVVSERFQQRSLLVAKSSLLFHCSPWVSTRLRCSALQARGGAQPAQLLGAVAVAAPPEAPVGPPLGPLGDCDPHLPLHCKHEKSYANLSLSSGIVFVSLLSLVVSRFEVDSD